MTCFSATRKSDIYLWSARQHALDTMAAERCTWLKLDLPGKYALNQRLSLGRCAALGGGVSGGGLPAAHAMVLQRADVAGSRAPAHRAPPQRRAQPRHGQAGGPPCQGGRPSILFLGTCWLPSVDPQLMARCPITDSVLGGPHNAARASAASVPGAWSAFFCHGK